MTSPLPFAADKRTVIRNGKRYSVWDEYPYRDENPAEVENWDFWSVFEAGAWEPALDDLLAQHLDPDGTFLDVGAWIGPVSLMAARLCRQVHAIEPDPVAAVRLAANVGRQRRKNITIHQTAISNSPGTLRIGRRADRIFGDSMTGVWFNAETIDVPATTLVALIVDNGIDNIGLVKMDIEGGEELILPQAADYIRGLGAPLLLSTHAALAPDPIGYLAHIRAALAPFRTELVAGNWNGLGTVLAIPR